MNYDKDSMEVEISPSQHQTLRGNIFLSHRQTPKGVYLMVYKYAP